MIPYHKEIIMDHSPFYRHRPESNIAVLLIHGILSTPRHFDWLIPSIPDDVEVYNILLKGHGGTVADFSKATMQQWQAQVSEAVKSIKRPGRKIILIGHSLGALLALQTAQNRRSICGLMLLNPPLKPWVRPSMVWRSLRFAFGRIRTDDPGDISCYQDLGVSLEPQLWKYLGWIPNFISLLILGRKCRNIPAKLSIPCFAYLGRMDELVHIGSKKWLQDCLNITLRFFPHGTHFGYSEPEKLLIEADFEDLLQQK